MTGMGGSCASASLCVYVIEKLGEMQLIAITGEREGCQHLPTAAVFGHTQKTQAGKNRVAESDEGILDQPTMGLGTGIQTYHKMVCGIDECLFLVLCDLGLCLVHPTVVWRVDGGETG